MDGRALNLILDMKMQLDEFCADHNTIADFVSVSRDGYHFNSAPCDGFQSSSQSTDSSIDYVDTLSLQASLGFARARSGRLRSGAADAHYMQLNENGNETRPETKFTTTDSNHMIEETLNQSLLTPQLIDSDLEHLAATGPYYNSNHSSASSSSPKGLSTVPYPTSGNATKDKGIFSGAPGRTSSASLDLDSAVSSIVAGPSNSDSIVRGNATQMKRALSEASSRTAAGGAQKKTKGDMDPENHQIYCLRQDNQQFDEIAEVLNKARAASGKPPNLTGNAIYGRYKRNAVLVAAVRGEVFKPSKIDLQAGTNLKAITQPVPTGFDDNEDRLLVEAYKYVRENTWSLVSRRLEETTGHVHDPADCADRFAYL